MAGLKEFRERIESDKGFAEKFQGMILDAVVEAAAEEGYVFSEEEIEELGSVSDAELEKVAGGINVVDMSFLV